MVKLDSQHMTSYQCLIVAMYFSHRLAFIHTRNIFSYVSSLSETYPPPPHTHTHTYTEAILFFKLEWFLPGSEERPPSKMKLIGYFF